MDAHQHRDQAPQDLDPGQGQRRPFHIALNIDWHEPQLERAGPDRGPPNRDRRQRQPELPPQLGQQERLHDIIVDEQLIAYSVVTVTVGLSVCALILMFTVLFFYVNVKFEEGFDFYRNMTDTSHQTSFQQTNQLVTYYEITYGCLIGVRALYFSLYMFKLDIYHHLSLGSYATALLLAVSSGHCIYEITHLAELIPRYSSAYEYIMYLSFLNLSTILKRQVILGCLAEWTTAFVLFISLRNRLDFACTPTIPGIAILVVGVFIIFY